MKRGPAARADWPCVEICVIERTVESVDDSFFSLKRKHNLGAGCLWDSILVTEGLRGHRACGERRACVEAQVRCVEAWRYK